MTDIGEIKSNTVVVIAGPTASGKSALAIELAEQYNGVVINADAMQVYRGTPVLSAAPTENDRQRVTHLLYEIFEPGKKGSVAEWMKPAVEAVREVWHEGKLPVVAGGTGFYIESLINGISPIPETGIEVRKQVAQMAEAGGTAAVYEYLRRVDAAGAAMVNPNDTTRIRRALEIFLDTRRSIAEWFKEPKIKPLPEAEFKVIPLLPELAELEQRCNERFDLMMQQGALQEVKNLAAMNYDLNLPVMKTIGVPELLSYIQGKCTFEEAVHLAKLHTRQYAKRQLTWFRNRLNKLDAEFIMTKAENQRG